MRTRTILLFLAAAAFGATLEPKQAFEQLRSYDYGHDISPLVAVEALVDQSSNDAPQRKGITVQLVAILQEPKTPNAAKQFICRQLERIGTDEHVPLLARLLADPQIVDDARRALQQIPGDAASAALRDALSKAEGNARIGLINSLGERRDPMAVEPLAKLISGAEAKAAIRALGRIGTAEAAATLSKAMEGAKPELAVAILHAQLRCADALVAAGDAKSAEAIYLPALDQKHPAIFRIAGLSGLVKTRKDKAAPLVIESLGDPNPQLRAAAAALARQCSGKEFTSSLLGLLDKADSQEKAAILGILAARGAREAVPLLDALVRKDDAEIRLAALRALGVLAETKHYPLLIAHVLAARAGPEAQAAEEAALQVAGRISVQADRVGPVLEALKRADSSKVPALLRLLGRNAGPEALAALRSLSTGPNEAARDAAVRALAEWPTEEAADDLLRLAQTSDVQSHRVLALRGYLRLAKTTKQLERAMPLVQANEGKRAFLAALGEAGDAAALKLAAAYVDDPRVRAEAILACLKLGDAVVDTDKEAVKAAMQKVLDAKPEKPLADRAQALFEGRRGFVPLFDGKTLNGWTSNGVGKWSVEEGAIVGNGTQKPGYAMLFSEKQYKDFTARFKYKVLAGNAGFYIRAEKLATNDGIRGLQVEIDPAKDNGGLFEVSGRDWVAKPDAKLPKEYFKPRDWNDVTVTAQGRRIVVTLNGHTTVDLPNDPGRTEGFFALGMHGGGVRVLFKDIEVLVTP